MSERKTPWTQGPWAVWNYGDLVVTCTGRDKAHPQEGMHIATVRMPENEGFRDLFQANARLISAAPDLVKLIMNYRGAATVTIPMDANRINDLHNEADALLAKIYGDET